MKNKISISGPAQVSLVGAETIAVMAELEGWSGDEYALALSAAIRHNSVSLDNQRERLVCLAAMGETADSTAGGALAQHFQVLEALFMRFSLEALEALQRGGHKSSEISERYASAAMRAQGASLRVLSALKALRDAPSPPTTPAAASVGAGRDGGPDNVEVLDAVPGKAK